MYWYYHHLSVRNSELMYFLTRIAPWGVLSGGFVFLVLFTAMGVRDAFAWAGSVAFGATYVIYCFARSESGDIDLLEYVIATAVLSVGRFVFGAIGAFIWPS
jgi:hypothetical protein